MIACFQACKREATFHWDTGGGYEYPLTINFNDTNFISYPLKDSLSINDSFTYAYMGQHILRYFNEPNLSLRYLGEPLFRFSYEGMRYPYIIILRPQEIIVKKGVAGALHGIEDTSRVSLTELLHYNLLLYNYPLYKSEYSQRKKKRIDSLVKLYPELLCIEYYKLLKDKITNFDSLPFHYTMERINLSRKKYNDIIRKLYETDFLHLPYRVEGGAAVLDGGGFFLEANLPHKYKFVVVPDQSAFNSRGLDKVFRELINETTINSNKIGSHPD